MSFLTFALGKQWQRLNNLNYASWIRRWSVLNLLPLSKNDQVAIDDGARRCNRGFDELAPCTPLAVSLLLKVVIGAPSAKLNSAIGAWSFASRKLTFANEFVQICNSIVGVDRSCAVKGSQPG
jgi:hypothetical protein